MPAAVVSFIGSNLVALGSVLGAGSAGALTAMAVGAAAVVAGAVAAQKLISELYSVPNLDSDRSRQATVRGTVEPQKLIYGEALVSGPISFVGVAGTDNRDLYHAIVLAGHPSESISDIYFDDERIQSAHINASGNVTTGTFGPKDGTTICVIRKLTGSQTTADSVLDGAFSTINSSEHIGTNLTYIVTKFTLTDKSQETWDKFMPNDIKALVKGKKVYDPRQDSTSSYYDANVGVGTQRSNDSTTWEWSENPVWCLVDYLTDNRFGMGIGLDRINLSKAVDAADICDATVSVPGGSEKRFTCNGVIFGTTTHKTNINKLLSSMNGMLTYTNGKYVIRAGAFEAVGTGMTLTEDHMTGPVKLKTSFERNERFNTITGTFIDPSKNYKEIEFPKVQITSALTRDNNEELTRELKLSMTNSRYMAQRIAHKLIQLSDLQKVLTFPTNLAGVNISVGDRVNVTLSEFGYTNKTFVCLGWTLSESGTGGVNLTLREDDSSSYADLAQSGYSTVTPAGGIQQGFFGVPDPSGLDATAHVESIELDWTNPANMTGIIAIEVFASPNSSWSSAVKIGETIGTQFIHDESNGVDPIVENDQRYYWVRARRFPSGEGSDAVSDRNPDSDTSTINATKGALGNLADLDTVGEAQIDDNAVGSDQINDDEVLHEVPSEGLAHYWPCNSVADVDGDGDEELQEVVAGKTGIHYGTTAPTVTTDSPTGKATSLGDENGFILLNDADADALEHTFTAGSFVSGTSYVIKQVGTTDFTAIGASANTVGTTFTATGAGTGTGVARVSNNAGFAWSMWFKSTSSSGNSEARLINRDPSDSWAILIDQSSGSQTVTFYGEPGTESVATISTDKWHHIAFSEDGDGTISIYFDGEFVSTEAYTPVVSDVPIGIGSDIENGTIRFGAYEFVGHISEIRAYNRALTAQEVRGLYKVPAASSPAELDGDMIIDGSLVAAKITVANLAEINDDVGTITGGDLGGVTIDSDKLYQGTGTWANSNTGFYLDDTGKFSLKDKLFFNPTNSRLTVAGNVTADTITVNDQLEVFGPLQASALADGTITREHFSQDAIDFIFGQLAPSVGGSNGDYKEASGNFTGSGGTVTVGSTSDKFDHGTLSVDVEFLCNHYFFITSNPSATDRQVTLNFEVSADGTFTDLTSATKTHTLEFFEYDLSSYYGYTYFVVNFNGEVTKTFTTGTGNDLVDGTNYIFRVRVDGVGSAFSGQTVPFTVEVNEGLEGVLSTGGNADTLDNLDSTRFLRSDENDTFDGDLTITGQLILQGSIDQYNVTDLDVTDKTITVNSGNTQSLSDGAGLIVDRGTASDASLTWNETNDRFDLSHPLEVNGDIESLQGIEFNPNGYSIRADSDGNRTLFDFYRSGSIHWQVYHDASGNLDFIPTNTAYKLKWNGNDLLYSGANISVGTISSGAVTSTALGTFKTLTLTGDSDDLTFTDTGGDWSILNAQQSNGLVIYDGTSGVTVLYNSAEVGQFDNSGFDVVSGALQVGGTTRISSAGAGTFTDITLSDVSPQIILSDTNSGGGGGAFGRILFQNTAGNAIGIGYTGDSPGDSDLIISTNAAGTYGGYMSLDAAAIVDTQADIILEPKTNVRIATGGLKIGTTTFVDSSRNITAGTISSGNITSSGNVQAGTSTGYLYAKSLRLDNGEVADSDFQHAYQMIVDANDALGIMSNKGDFAGGYPFGIFFLGDDAGTTKTLGSGLVGVWNTTNFKKVHVDHMVGLYDGTQNLTAPDISVTGNLDVAQSIRHTSDTDTAINFFSDQVEIRTGGTPRLSITNSDFIFTNTQVQFDSTMGIGAITYAPIESGADSERNWLNIHRANNASYIEITNRTPAGKVVLSGGLDGGGGEVQRLEIEGGSATKSVKVLASTDLNLSTTSKLTHGTTTILDASRNLAGIESADIDGFVLENSAHRTGLLNIPQRDSANSYTGIMLKRDDGDHWAVMASDDLFGIYDDINSDWALQASELGGVRLYYAGSNRLETVDDGVEITGRFAAAATNIDNAFNFWFTDSDADNSYAGMRINYDASDNTTLTGDRNHIALEIDYDVSATGGDTSNEYRAYALSIDVRGAGDTDIRRGVYSYTETQHDAGTVSENVAVYGYAVSDETGTGRTTNNYGGLFLAYEHGTGSGGTNTHYGVFAKAHANSLADKNIGSMYGVYAEVEYDTTGATTAISTAYGVRSVIDNDSTDTTLTNSYLFHGSYEGTINANNAYGLYISGNVENYFAGHVRADQGYKVGSSTIIDASANLTNIGTISAGNTTITNSGSAASVTVTRSDTSTSAVFLVGSAFSYIGTSDNKPFHIYQNGASALEFNTSKDAAFAGDISCDAITTTDHISLPDSKYLRLGDAQDFIIYHDGASNYLQTVKQDSDLIIRGNDGGTNFNALTIDMSANGNATFSGDITAQDLTLLSTSGHTRFTLGSRSGDPTPSSDGSYDFRPGMRVAAFEPSDGSVDGDADLPLAWNGSLYLAGSQTYATASANQVFTFTVNFSGGTRWFAKVKTNDAESGNYPYLAVNAGTEYALEFADAPPSNGENDTDAWHVIDITDDVVTGSNTLKVWLGGGQKTYVLAIYVYPSTGIMLPNEPYESVGYFHKGIGIGDSRIFDEDANLSNVGTISSGNITSSGTVTANSVVVNGIERIESDGDVIANNLTVAGNFTMTTGSFSVNGNLTAANGYVKAGTSNSNGFWVGSNQILEGDTRNLKNIGTISCGDITATKYGFADTEHFIEFRSTSAISGLTADTTHISGRQIDMYAYDDIYIRTGTADSIYLYSGGDATLTLDNSNNATFEGNIYLGSTNNSDYLTGNSKLTIDGYMMVKGIINTDETGTGATGITFGNGSTLGTDQISLITSGARQFYISSTGVAQFSEDVLVLGDNLDIQQSLRHNGNTDTRIEFTTNQMDFKTSATARLTIDTANVTIKDDLIVEDTSPVITISDTTNGGGGGAEGKIIFKNTEGNAIGIGYTGDVITDSDLIISTDAGGTYGAYLGLDAAGISDTQSDIILEPKTSVRIANGGLKVGTTEVISSTGRFYSTSSTVTKPAFSFDGDSNTGMYHMGADQIGFTIGGSNKVYIEDSTYVLNVLGAAYLSGDLTVAGDLSVSGSSPFLTSDDYDTHVCHLKTNVSAAVDQGVGNEFTVNFNLEEHNDSTTFSHSSGVVTVATAGWYRIYANMVYQNGSSSARNTVRAYVEKNGTEITSTATYDYDRGSSYGEFSNNKIETMLYLAANDTIGIGNYAENEDGVITIEAAECEFIVSSVSVQTTTTNADTVDGLHASSFIRSDAADTVSGEITFSSNIYVADRIIHNSDENTYLEFLGDRVRILSGNVEMIDCVESTTDYVDIVDRVRVTAGGDLECEGNITAYTSTSISDINQKENIQRIESPIEKIKEISGYTFDWKQSGEHSGGVIAQEIEQVMPDIVKEKSIRDGEKMKAVDYQAIIGLLVETVKDLNQRIEDLENGDD